MKSTILLTIFLYLFRVHSILKCFSDTFSSVLQDVHQMLHADIIDKISALDIDKECAELCNTSGTISLHDDPTRIKKGWDYACHYHN